MNKLLKKKEIEKANANDSFENLPEPNIKISLHNKKNIKDNKKEKKKKYLDSILNEKFIANYFKKKELKIKNLK